MGLRGNSLSNSRQKRGRKREMTFQNAPVMIPILSSGKITDEDNDVTYTKWGGYIRDNFNGDISKFIRAYGVYWIKMICEDGLLRKKPDADFGRPGP